MRNLKRTLSLALAALMLMGMMVVSAGAASKDFTDKDEIKHTEAVNTLVTLNVISGKNDGSYFDPTGTLTRAEMAKLITYVLNGGVEPVLGEKVKPTYSDIDGHWAEKYIEYCSSMGIIAGDGAGKFNPEGTLTAEQSAKMLLTAMNYKADIFGFVGNDWAINVNREANAAGLYEELGSLSASSPISRDAAAQMVYNAIQANTMELTWSQDVSTGEVTQTYKLVGPSLFADKFKGNIYEGVLLSSGKYAVTVAGKSGSAATNRLSIALQRTNGGTKSTVDNATVKSFDCDVNYTDLMGQYVKVIAGKNDAVYGVYSVKDENKVLLNTTTNKVSMDGSKVKVDGTAYDLASTTAVIVNGGVSVGTIAATYPTAPKAADSIKLISYDGDSSIDLALVETMGVSQVNYVGTDSFTLTVPFGGTRTVGTGSNPNNYYKSASQKMADVTVYDGVAKDDFVIVTKDLFADKDVVEKVEVTTMTVTGTKGTVGTDAQFLMDDGNWYKYAANVLTTSASTAEAALKAGDTVNVIAVGNIMFFVTKTSANQGIKNVAFVINAVNNSTAANPTTQAYLLFSDGTKKVVDTDKNYGLGGTDLRHQLVTFRQTNDGYVLTDLTGQTAATLGFETISANDTQAINGVTVVTSLGGKEIADDAVIMLYPSTSTGVSKIITGAELKRVNVNKFTASTASFATTKVNGFEKVAVATIKVNEVSTPTDAAAAATTGYNTATGNWLLGITSGSNYGYLVIDAYGTTVDGVDYTNFKMVFNGQTVELKEKMTYNPGTFKAGSIVAFDVVSDTEIKNVASAGATIGAVSALNAKGDEVQFVPNDGTNASTQTYKLNSDTTYIYVDTANKAAATGGSLNLAGKAGTVYVPNVAYLTDGSANGDVLLVVVDVNNQYAVDTVTVGGSAAAINDALNGNDATTAATSIPGGVTIPEGRTLTLTGAATSWGAITVRGTLKIDASLACTGVAGNITGVTGARVILGTGSTMADATNFYAVATASGAGAAPTGGAPASGTTYVWTTWTYTNTTNSATTSMAGWVAVQ